MGVARTVAEARAIVASGRMAVFLGIESGFDHEGDPDVLAAFYRLGLRSIQFATQSGFNAFSDSALAATQGGQTPDPYHGINERGRALVRRMNELGILIEITHGTEAVHLQLIEASRAPVVASRAADGGGVGRTDRLCHQNLGCRPCRTGPRSGGAVPQTPSGYPDLLAQLRGITSEDNVRKIAGENWLRVLAAAPTAASVGSAVLGQRGLVRFRLLVAPRRAAA